MYTCLHVYILAIPGMYECLCSYGVRNTANRWLRWRRWWWPLVPRSLTARFGYRLYEHEEYRRNPVWNSGRNVFSKNGENVSGQEVVYGPEVVYGQNMVEGQNMFDGQDIWLWAAVEQWPWAAVANPATHGPQSSNGGKDVPHVCK